jgi:hypothetical protein
VVCFLKDVICGRDFGGKNSMVFITEHVGDMFAASIAHDDFDKSIMLEGWADVPHIQCMNTP